jgi:hypothetical protein
MHMGTGMHKGTLVQREIKGDIKLEWAEEGDKLGPCQDKRDGTEVGIHGGVGGAVSGDDDGIGVNGSESGSGL